jgi:hypothetical protein
LKNKLIQGLLINLRVWLPQEVILGSDKELVKEKGRSQAIVCVETLDKSAHITLLECSLELVDEVAGALSRLLSKGDKVTV